MRALRVAILAALTLSVALLPLASAQTFINPLCAPPPGYTKAQWCTYDQEYLVMGRVVDVHGNPAKGASVLVTLEQDGVVAADGRRPTESGKANCKGDFEFAFHGLRTVSSAGKAHVTVAGVDGNANLTVAQALDPFWRRNDVVVKLPYAWGYVCEEQNDAPWGIQISVKGRLVNRTAPYDIGGVTYHGEPYTGPIALRWWDTEGFAFCPPHGDGRCATTYTDELGNFKYTWTFDKDVVPGGQVEVVAHGVSTNASVDPTTRLAIHRIDLTGQGPPAEETPGPGALLAILALVGAAVAWRSRARR